MLVETGILSFEIRNSAQVPYKRTRNLLHEANPWLICSVKYQITSLLMSSSPISISSRLFRCRYSNFRDVIASSPSFCRPAARAPRRARSHAKEVLDVNALLLLLAIPYPSPPRPLRVMLYTYTCGVRRNFAFLWKSMPLSKVLA